VFILALYGGGIRGAYSARLLQRLELSFSTLITGADLVAGTSTGAAGLRGL
jgi:patatin-like phospholipase/acyl hydrolase